MAQVKPPQDEAVDLREIERGLKLLRRQQAIQQRPSLMDGDLFSSGNITSGTIRMFGIV